MTVTLTDYKAYIGETSADKDEILNGFLTQAVELVTAYNVKYDSTTDDWVASDAPTSIVDRATLEVAANLWNRRITANQSMNRQFATAEGAATPVRFGDDPMQGAYKLLRRWVLPL